MNKRQRIISKALSQRLPTITYGGYVLWYADGTAMIRATHAPNRILSASAAAVGYIYHQLGHVMLPRRSVRHGVKHMLADLLTDSDIQSLLANLGVTT